MDRILFTLGFVGLMSFGPTVDAQITQQEALVIKCTQEGADLSKHAATLVRTPDLRAPDGKFHPIEIEYAGEFSRRVRDGTLDPGAAAALVFGFGQGFCAGGWALAQAIRDAHERPERKAPNDPRQPFFHRPKPSAF